MVMKLADLRKLPKNELWKLYDQEADHVVPFLNHYRDEIIRREQCTQTKWLIVLTAVVAIGTVVSIIAVCVA